MISIEGGGYFLFGCTLPISSMREVLLENRIKSVACYILILYGALSIWRLVSYGDYKEDVIADDGNRNSLETFYVERSDLVYSNYVLVLVFAVAILFCGWHGAKTRDANLLRWNYWGSAVCGLVMAFTLVNLFIVGSLCGTSAGNDCTVGNLASWWISIILVGVLLGLYIRAAVLSFQMRNVCTSRPVVTMSSFNVVQSNELKQEANDNIPYATPV